MLNVISAIGQIGTFIMALFYFISVTLQLYQMKIAFIPALGFNQILIKRSAKGLTLHNTAVKRDGENEEDFLQLYNLGGGAAKQITIEIYIEGNEVLERKFVSMLPSKEGYLLPINKDVFDEIEKTIKNNGYESNLKLKLTYKHNVSRKQQELYLNGKIDVFNTYDDEAVYELQFINIDQ
ncbi:hypothetical protein [Staphylococcus kloosii]|jgi:hypothetical protein|uniref:Uncharacterized protein n=1 Tax=Staphylococcus kloosii TaxID=29384 RepID=A0A921KUW8_9STAP|nr:hypothetical protein [Staphylococcus kloosii]AVQ34733.1 hypothetical protein C7J89_00720 [Staphylococcus kloosii]PNZ07647.1 hypothetical protein CD136_02675 [Staphylococcus kloosii]PTJ77465.1 hypothetical protein BUZ59_07680 [Staphylococcus kloosii]SUM50289.1 membrane protein [Staphylococcus kloosii]GEP81987.1 hypothetical protein SKL01_11650 [Staphylococcus kloosii]